MKKFLEKNIIPMIAFFCFLCFVFLILNISGVFGYEKSKIRVPLKKSMDNDFREILVGTIYYYGENDTNACYYFVKQKDDSIAVVLSPSFNILTNSTNLIPNKVEADLLISLRSQLYTLGIIQPLSLKNYVDENGDYHIEPFHILDRKYIKEVAVSVIKSFKKRSGCEVTKGYGWDIISTKVVKIGSTSAVFEINVDYDNVSTFVKPGDSITIFFDTPGAKSYPWQSWRNE